MALLAGGAGIDAEPDRARGPRGCLRLLHVAAAIMLLHERAAGVIPFEHHHLALEVGELDDPPVGIVQLEVGRGLTHERGRRGGGGDNGQSGESGEHLLHLGFPFLLQLTIDTSREGVRTCGRISTGLPGS
jgi:hypothetical protein